MLLYTGCFLVQKFPSAITSILGGRVLNPNCDELIITTYAGEVIGMVRVF